MTVATQATSKIATTANPFNMFLQMLANHLRELPEQTFEGLLTDLVQAVLADTLYPTRLHGGLMYALGYLEKREQNFGLRLLKQYKVGGEQALKICVV